MAPLTLVALRPPCPACLQSNNSRSLAVMCAPAKHMYWGRVPERWPPRPPPLAAALVWVLEEWRCPTSGALYLLDPLNNGLYSCR